MRIKLSVHPERSKRVKWGANFIFFSLSVFFINSDLVWSFDWFPHWEEHSIVFKTVIQLMIFPAWLMMSCLFTALINRAIDFSVALLDHAEL